MSQAIYTNTLMKFFKHKFVLTILFFTVFMFPLATLQDIEAMNRFNNPFLVAFLLGMLVVTLTSPFPASISMSGRMDYMPLIITRPLPRWKFVISKWLALSTIVCGALVLQQIVLVPIELFHSVDVTLTTFLCQSIDRILIGLNFSAVVSFIYLLPTEMAILVAILILQASAGAHLFTYSPAFPHTEMSTTFSGLCMELFEFKPWYETKMVPLLFGGYSAENLDNYLILIRSIIQFMAPNLNTYDLLNARPIYLTPLLVVISNTLIALTLATLILNARDFHYDTD